MNFATRVEYNARSQPTDTALYTLDEEFTWKEIDELSNRFANLLRTYNIDTDDKLALYAPSISEFVPVLYGSMKAGVVPMPINMRFEPKEIQHMIDHVEHKAVFCRASESELLSELDTESVEHAFVVGEPLPDLDGMTVHSFTEAIEAVSPEFETVPRLDDEPAFFMHTSGTTGRAKPVIATHGTIRAHALGYIDRLELTDADVALNAVPLFHNGGLNLHLTLFTQLGAPQVLLNGWDAEPVLKAIEEFRTTYMFVVPTMLYDLINRDPEEAEEAYDVTSHRIVGIGGQNVPEATTREFEERFGAQILEGYGLTETMPIIVSNGPHDRKLGTAGRPVENVTTVRIVDIQDWQTEVATDELGELIASGDVVSPGYYERPEKNDDDFEVDEDGRRWLHTGDIARVDEEGYITIEDRVDNMIISGGENVYPNEVEQVLFEMDAVAEAVVVGEPHERWGERVAAAIVSRNEDLTEEAVFDYFEENDGIADYKRPRKVIFLDELPRSGPGKIDRMTIKEEHFSG